MKKNLIVISMINIGAYDDPKRDYTRSPDGFQSFLLYDAVSRDLRKLNHEYLIANNFSWYHFNSYTSNDITNNVHDRYIQKASDIVNSIGNTSICVIADSSFILTFSLWKKVLNNPACIIIWPDPLQLAKKLKKSRNLFINQGVAIWEYYINTALKNSIGLKRLLINYEDLVAKSTQSNEEIAGFIKKNKLEIDTRFDWSQFFNSVNLLPKKHESSHTNQLKGILNNEQFSLLCGLNDKSVLDLDILPEVSKGCYTGLNDINRLLEIEKSSAMAVQIARFSSALIESMQYRFSRLVFKFYRKLIGHKDEMLILSHERNLNLLISDFLEHRKEHIFDMRLSDSAVLNNNGQMQPKRNYLPSKYRSVSVDIVICVHNALDDVQNALASITANDRDYNKIIIINDGSDKLTGDYLRHFSEKKDCCQLIENSTAIGYTAAANQGLTASTAEFIILVNSDVIVPIGWIERLKLCAYSSKDIGIVGPISNAATWQSVPKRFNEGSGWNINDIPKSWSVNNVQSLVSNISERRYMKTQILNGFCLGIKRDVIEKIGYFDEESFPQGYGEENDFCIRAIKAGFQLAVTDDLFVYHAKSKSFGPSKRNILSKNGDVVLKKKYGRKYAATYTKEINKNAALERMRNRIATAYEWNISFEDRVEKSPLKILFLLPCEPGGGGVHSVMQEVHGLNRMNFSATVAIPFYHQEKYKQCYSQEFLNSVHFYVTFDEIVKTINKYSVIIATFYKSIILLKKLWDDHKSFLPAYYIQDYEPWFEKVNFVSKWIASRSYNKIPRLCCFAKTNWICDIVQKKHNVTVHRVMPSLDHDVFYPGKCNQNNEDKRIIHISAMIRPTTPRRRAGETMAVLRKIKLQFQGKVKVHIFGTNSDDPSFLKLERGFQFTNHGFLTREGVANLLRNCNLFLDMSEWQAFGRTGIESMACGCTPILPEKGGVYEYAIDQYNALIVNTDKCEEVVNVISKIIKNPEKLSYLKSNGIKAVGRYSISLASKSIALLFLEHAYHKKQLKFK